MSKRSSYSFLALALALATATAFVIGNSAGTGAGLTDSAAAALPASNFVLVVDVQRALNEAVPSLLAGNPALLAKFTAHLDEFEKKTGINPRVFESVAIGADLQPNGPAARRDDNGVVIASGSFNSVQLLDAAFAAAAKECEFVKTEEQYEGKTIYVISGLRSKKTGAVTTNSPTTNYVLPYDRFGDPRSGSATASKAAGSETPVVIESKSVTKTTAVLTTAQAIDPQYSARVVVANPPAHGFAVVALGPNSIAIGSLDRVRAVIDASLGRNRVDGELVRQALQNPNSIVGFSGRIPQIDNQKLDAQNPGNPFAGYFASLRGFYGSFSVSGSDVESFIAVRTENADQAHDISQAINSIKSLASFGMAQSTGVNARERDMFAAILKGLTIDASGNEIRIDLKVPQSTLAPFIRMRQRSPTSYKP